MRAAVPALASALAALCVLAAAPPAMASKLNDAEAAFAANRDADAVALYTEVIDASAADPAAQAGAYFGRGEVNAAVGRTDMGIADFTAALALKQDDAARANTLFSRAEAYTRKRNWQPAVDDYAEAIRLAPTMLGVHFGRGRALRALKRDDEAAKEYEAELKLNPDSYRTQSARADLLGLPQPEDTYSKRVLRSHQDHAANAR